MKKFLKNLVALIGISLLGIGIANATTPSSDCGDDDDMQPINVQSVTKVIIKES